MKLIAKLFAGPVDVVGDIHGEIAALRDLMDKLGYTADGSHPEHRRLVFVGDLVDRGPDSPEVLRVVKRLVENGTAMAVLGNHELAILCEDEKKDNVWWTAPHKLKDHDYEMVPMPEAEKSVMRAFLAGLPLILERDDLVVLHACWNEAAVAKVRAEEGNWSSAAELYEHYAATLAEGLIDDDLPARAAHDIAEHGIDINVRGDDNYKPPIIESYAELESRKTLENPVAILTKGIELPARESFWVGGKWRMCDRIRWWDKYIDKKAVIFGHYWRMLPGAAEALDSKFGPDLFANVEAHHLMNKPAAGNLYCIDFSVAGRAKLRKDNKDLSVCKLGAVRVPEWDVVFDDGERLPLSRKK